MPTAAKIVASTISGLVKFSTPPTKIPGGEQNGRDEKEGRAVTVQPGAEPDPQQKQNGHGPNREPIVRRSRLRARDRLFQPLKIAGFGLKTQLKPLATRCCVMFEFEMRFRLASFSKKGGRYGAQ